MGTLLKSVEQAHDNLHRALRSFSDAHPAAEQLQDAGVRDYLRQIGPASREFQVELLNLRQFFIKYQYDNQTQLLTMLDEAYPLILGVLLLALLLGLSLSIYTSVGMSREIVKAVNFAEKMNDADFSSRIPQPRKDETGSLAKALNSTAINLSSILHELSP